MQLFAQRRGSWRCHSQVVSAWSGLGAVTAPVTKADLTAAVSSLRIHHPKSLTASMHREEQHGGKACSLRLLHLLELVWVEDCGSASLPQEIRLSRARRVLLAIVLCRWKSFVCCVNRGARGSSVTWEVLMLPSCLCSPEISAFSLYKVCISHKYSVTT